MAARAWGARFAFFLLAATARALLSGAPLRMIELRCAADGCAVANATDVAARGAAPKGQNTCWGLQLPADHSSPTGAAPRSATLSLHARASMRAHAVVGGVLAADGDPAGDARRWSACCTRAASGRTSEVRTRRASARIRCAITPVTGGLRRRGPCVATSGGQRLSFTDRTRGRPRGHR